MPKLEDDGALSDADETLVEELQDREKLEGRVQRDGAAILIRLGRIARGNKDPRVATAAAKEYRVWADGLLGRRTANEER